MQTGDRPDPFRIAGGLLLFVFAAHLIVGDDAAAVASRFYNGNFKFFCARAQNFRKFIVQLQQTARRVFPAGRFGVMLRAYQRTVRGAAVKELNVAVASVSANTCVLPSSAAYMLCSSG